MPDKQTIIDNIETYAPAQIADFVRAGDVTYEELCELPEFSRSARKEVKELLASGDDQAWTQALTQDAVEAYETYLRSFPEGKHRQEARDAKARLNRLTATDAARETWEAVEKGDAGALREFIGANPDSPFTDEAKRLLADLTRDRFTRGGMDKLRKAVEKSVPAAVYNKVKRALQAGEVSADELLEQLRRDQNWLPYDAVVQLVADGRFSLDDLACKCGVNEKFLEHMANNDDETDQSFAVPAAPIVELQPHTTEVFFWGIPASGKTCALGGIMSALRNGRVTDSYTPNIECQGFNYMTRLSQMFGDKEKVVTLPAGTQTDAIFEMAYVLTKGKYEYPLTFIDMAGELLEIMYLKSAREPVSEQQQAALDTVSRCLSVSGKRNRQIHFFVLEYDGHKRLYKGLTQQSLLDGALGYIEHMGIFNRNTDCIFLLFTKSDRTGLADPEERNEKLGEYVEDHYLSFYNGLKTLCKKEEINRGEVECIPFSVGEVSFQSLCLFDDAASANVIRHVMEHCIRFRIGAWAKIAQKARS